MPQNIGTVVQIIGAVLDIKFPPEHLPNLLNAIEIEHEGKKLTVEVAQHIGDDTVRCIAMGSTDGLVRLFLGFLRFQLKDLHMNDVIREISNTVFHRCVVS